MEYFAISTWKKIVDAMGKSALTSADEIEGFVEHYSRIIENISVVAPKELEAYLAIQSCRSYKQLADLILAREGKALAKGQYEKFLMRLPPRASRGRNRIVREIKKIYKKDRK